MPTVSTKPWSNFKESDYDDAQWLRACLIDRGSEAGTAKQRGSLPVREPDGTLNKNAIAAAAAALAGARGGVKASTELKTKAARALIRLYGTIEKDPPDSLKSMAHSLDAGDFLEHAVSGTKTVAAIMAIPAPLESIHLVGDEDKHATLLFFGETNTLPDDAKDILVESVKMACAMLFRFSETTYKVSRLGEENPPALVAMLSNDNLSQVRNLFMMNPAVKGYLDNTSQFPSFTPHVTLGRPDFAEEMVLRLLMDGVHRIRFDRLAVWWNDERIEFALGPTGEGDFAAMSEAIDKFLEHHGVKAIVEPTEEDAEQSGVKGMKWGVRRRVDPKTGLVARTSSADQIHVDRIAKKLHSGGVSALSNKDLQDFSTRIQREQEFNRARSSQEAQRSKPFIQRFLATQGKRQFTRVTDKAIDIAVEKALEQAGIHVGKKGGKAKDVADILTETGIRLKPKKKGGG
jgi:2'-5' RNA ligase